MAEDKKDLTPLTPEQIEEAEEAKMRYRFGGTKYQLQGSSNYLDDRVVYELPGLFAYPKSEEKPE